eukprot:gene2085-1266_t
MAMPVRVTTRYPEDSVQLSRSRLSGNQSGVGSLLLPIKLSL